MAIVLSNKVQSVDYGDILQPTANMTVCCWFYNTDNSTYQMLFGREDVTGPGWHLEINASQKGGFHADTGSAMVLTTTTIALNTWYHIVGVRDTSTGNQRIYLNGVLEGTAAYGTLTTVVNQMQIGETIGWPGQGFVGIMDDLRVYDRALSDNEIQTIYACRGSDTIVYGLQARWLFAGPDGGVMGSFATIAINNAQNASSDSSASSITLAYTAPAGSNLILVVAATAESTVSGRVLATGVTFNGNALSNVASVRITASPYNGVSMWSKSVTSGESGDIVVTWSNNNGRRTVLAYTLSGASGDVEATATSFSNSGTTTTGLTTINDGTLVATACANEDGYVMTAVGTNHVVNSTVVAGAHAGAIGSVPVATAGAISGIGFTASPVPNGEALVLAAFTPVNTTEQITELSNNEFVGTAVMVPKYVNQAEPDAPFLKVRRSLY